MLSDVLEPGHTETQMAEPRHMLCRLSIKGIGARLERKTARTQAQEKQGQKEEGGKPTGERGRRSGKEKGAPLCLLTNVIFMYLKLQTLAKLATFVRFLAHVG